MPRAFIIGGVYLCALVGVAGLSAILARTGDPEVEPPRRAPAAIRGVVAATGGLGETTLHRAHVLGARPIACAECHAIEPDGFAPPDRERCMICHPTRQAAVHAAVEDADARECTSCHDFLDTEPTLQRAWQCGACHDRPHGDQHQMLGNLAEVCGQCHTAHGSQSAAPTSCLGCHEDKETAHGAYEDPGTQACLTCHRQHDEAIEAQSRCAPCHEREHPRVPASATFPGHDRCTDCHEPHSFSRKTVRTCRSCHARKEALVSERIAEHRACASCHDQHAPTAAGEARCKSCHESPHLSHPPDARGNDCLGCHPAHPQRDRAGIAVVACSSCHQQARDDRAFHAGARCTDCHAAHHFTRPALEPGFCLGCHTTRAGRRAAIVVSAGHADCSACHDRTPHAPATAPPCATCHTDQATTAPAGHATCESCHEQHSGALLRGAASCTSCHPNARQGPHRDLDGGCNQCHRPHGPGGVPEPPACISCHQRSALPGAHLVAGHDTCTDCHASHGTPRTDPASCRGCHGDLRDHEPQAASCIGCHVFTRGTP
jgi:hypothetical protein